MNTKGAAGVIKFRSIHSFQRRQILSGFLAIMLLGLAGCVSTRHGQRDAKGDTTSVEPSSDNNRPRIHHLGSQAVLTFKPGLPLEIPIVGQALDAPAMATSVSVESVVPLQAIEHYYVTNLSSGYSLLILKSNATAVLKSKDPLTVNMRLAHTSPKTPPALQSLIGKADSKTLATVQGGLENLSSETELSKSAAALAYQIGRNGTGVSNEAVLQLLQLAGGAKSGENTQTLQSMQAARETGANFSDSNKAPGEVLAAGSRRFILFDADDYRRDFLSTRVELQNITAFPLPNREAQKLFGWEVADTYFAVRLTLRNTSNKDRLVSLGMVKAYGRAMLSEKKNGVDASFTIPIDVAPQSQQHVYALVLGGKPYKAREWVFRTLEFSGALATAFGNGFGASEDYVKAVAIFTGVVIPAGRELWPDKVPFTLLNIVNFGMPDLIKVPKNGSIDGKYIFFSKGELQATIQDPAMYRGFRDGAAAKKLPNTQVVYLSFDTLEIPFETVETLPGESLASRVEVVRSKIQTSITEYETLQSEWLRAKTHLGLLKFADYDSTTNILNTAYGRLKDISNLSTNADMTNIAAKAWSSWQRAVRVFEPARLDQFFFQSRIRGPLALADDLKDLQDISIGLLASKPPELYEARLKTIESKVAEIRSVIVYVEALAAQVASDEFQEALKTASSSDDTEKRLAAFKKLADMANSIPMDGLPKDFVK